MPTTLFVVIQKYKYSAVFFYYITLFYHYISDEPEMKGFNNIYNRFANSEQRSQLLIKNIAASFIIKGWSLLVQLLLVPVALNCLTIYEYGLWLTLSSVITWMDNFDIGLGNGLRNKLAEAIAHNDLHLAKVLISTAIITLSLIALILLISLVLVVNIVDLYATLNVNKSLVPNLRLVSTLLCITISLTFAAKIISSFFLALQKPATNNLMASVASTLTLIGLWILTILGNKNFLLVCLIFTVMPLFSYISFGIYAFKYKYKIFCPSIKFFKKSAIKPLVNLGMKFFIGQISGMLLMSTANIIISKALSPAEVAPYQIAYKYFMMITIFFTLISTPIWSATTDAYNRGDITWIKSIVKKIEYIESALFILIIAMLFLSNSFYSIWTAGKVQVDFGLSIWVAIYTFVLLLSMGYSNVIYGIGKMNLTVATVCLMSLLFIFTAYPITKEFGIKGLIAVQTLVTIICTLQNMIQCKLILSGNAHGIFNK